MAKRFRKKVKKEKGKSGRYRILERTFIGRESFGKITTYIISLFLKKIY